MNKEILKLFRGYLGKTTISIDDSDGLNCMGLFNQKALKFGIMIPNNAPKDAVDEAIKLYGKNGKKWNQCFHKNFSVVANSSIEELIFQQIIHYFTTYGFEGLDIYNSDKVYIPKEKLEIPELEKDIEMIIIEPLSKEEVSDKLMILLTSGIALSKDTINMSLLNNDPLLVYKIVCLFEGTYQNKEIFKLDLDKKEIKIITNVKEGITLKLFSCVLEEEVLSDYGDVLCSFISSFKKKKEMSKEFDKQIEELKEKEGNVNKKLAITKTEVIKRENKILMLFCNKLNEKKEQLRQLKTIIDNDGMDLKDYDNHNNNIPLGTELQKHNSSGLKFDDSQKNSNNLSLLDL